MSPSGCPWPGSAAPRCGGTRRCSCWGIGRQRRRTPSSPPASPAGGARWGASPVPPQAPPRQAPSARRHVGGTATGPAAAPSAWGGRTVELSATRLHSFNGDIPIGEQGQSASLELTGVKGLTQGLSSDTITLLATGAEPTDFYMGRNPTG